MVGVIENKMSKAAEKLRQIEVEISAEKGNFNLFALVERDDSMGKWDVVASAEWTGDRTSPLVSIIAKKIRKYLTKDEQIMLSRIVVLPSTDPFVRSLNMIGVEHGVIRLSNNSFNGIFIREAYLITSKSS